MIRTDRPPPGEVTDVSMVNPGSDCAAVAAAVRQRMTALKITTAGLAGNGDSAAALTGARSTAPRPGPRTVPLAGAHTRPA